MTVDDAGDRASIAGLVLAAGESSRMGRDKALLAYRGRTFLDTIVYKLRAARLERVVVVLGHHAEIIRRAADLSACEVVINLNYLRGQTSSLQSGLAALKQAGAGPAAIVLGLVDHPAFEPATVSALMAEFHRTAAQVIIPTYQSRRGHPVLIGEPLFGPLLALDPDRGANSLIRAADDQTRTVEVPDPGILADVDDPESYRALERAS
jgi:molybdenum cofactor cytidylyltransferase